MVQTCVYNISCSPFQGELRQLTVFLYLENDEVGVPEEGT